VNKKMNGLAPSPAHSVLLAAYLVSTSKHHGAGSFAGGVSFDDKAHPQTLKTMLDTFIGMSPRLCREDVEVHVVHDLPNVSLPSYRGIQLHAVPPDATYLGGDRRWSLYASLMRTGGMLHRASSKCVWAVDLDVAVLALPHCTQIAPATLYVGSDSCSPRTKSWLHEASKSTRLNSSWDEEFQEFLVDRRPMFNSGIVGGRRGIFDAATDLVAERLEAHRAFSPATQHNVGADMLLWNWVAVIAVNRSYWSHPRAGGLAPLGRKIAAVVTGYPNGPVNYPMWARLPADAGLCPAYEAPDHRPCGSECSYRWLRNGTSLGQYWTGHKLSRGWLNLLRLHACWPGAAGTVRGQQALERHGARKFRCECQVVGRPPDVRTSI
jgi:hypothetical protein